MDRYEVFGETYCLELRYACSGCLYSADNFGKIWSACGQQEIQYTESVLNKYKKCTLVRALRLCTGRAAHRESRGIDLLFFDHGTGRG